MFAGHLLLVMAVETLHGYIKKHQHCKKCCAYLCYKNTCMSLSFFQNCNKVANFYSLVQN